MRPRLRQRLAVLAALVVGVAGSVVTGLLTAGPAAATDNGLSIRPAMGWSSWSFVRRWPDEAKIKAQASAMVSSGLASHGYVYINLDDFWQLCDGNGFVVDGFGRWVVDPAKFPNGIKALADYVHGLGLKFGFYVTPGIPKNAVLRNTPIEGTPYHAADIANTSTLEKNYNCHNMYFIDYLKIDGVGSSDIPDVQAWATALRKTGRQINYALSNNLAIADAATWRKLANSWRTQGDVECYCGPGPNGSGYPLTDWSHISSRFGSAASWQQWGGPSGWNDLDSLQIGNGDQIGLNADQRRTVMTLWAMAASPLLLGSDLTNLTSVDLAILTNDRLIAVNQDGYTSQRIVNSGVNQVWRKREDNGDFIVALYNTDTSGSSTVSVNWSQVGFTGSATVTDLWSGASLGTISNSYSATLRPGEPRLIRARPTSGRIVRYQAENATITPGTVDNNHVGFTGTGFANPDNVAGSFVEWAVNAESAGSQSLRIRYANGTTTNRPMDISVNGTVVATNVAFNGTSSWDTWATSTVTANLNAGSNTVRATATTATGGPNVDYLEVAPPAPASTTVEAESGTLSGAARLASCSACSGGQKVGFIGNGSTNHVTLSVTAATSGTRQMTIAGLVNGTRTFFVSVNGGAGIQVPMTGTSFATPITTSINVTLNAVTNTIGSTTTRRTRPTSTRSTSD